MSELKQPKSVELVPHVIPESRYEIIIDLLAEVLYTYFCQQSYQFASLDKKEKDPRSEYDS